ncbi:MAG: hypothetical protein ABIP75_02965 [Pyrinomonadaceae bacterium]
MKYFPRTVFVLLLIGILCICAGVSLRKSWAQRAPETFRTTIYQQR